MEKGVTKMYDCAMPDLGPIIETEAEAGVHPQHRGHLWRTGVHVVPRVLLVYESTAPAGYVGGSRSCEWVLDYNLTPFGRCRVGSRGARWRQRRECELHVYPPNTVYWEDTSSAGVASTRGIFAAFTGGELTPLPSLLRGGRYARFLDPSRRLSRLLEGLVEVALLQGEPGFWEAQARFGAIMALLGRSRRRGPGTFVIGDGNPNAPPTEFMARARSYMHEHLSEPITRGDVARHLHMSVSGFAHRYHRESGEPPMTSLTRIRLQLVKSLLLKGNRLKSIAAQTGFYDQYHLSKTFKRWEGVSPRGWSARAVVGPDG